MKPICRVASPPSMFLFVFYFPFWIFAWSISFTERAEKSKNIRFIYLHCHGNDHCVNFLSVNWKMKKKKKTLRYALWVYYGAISQIKLLCDIEDNRILSERKIVQFFGNEHFRSDKTREHPSCRILFFSCSIMKISVIILLAPAVSGENCFDLAKDLIFFFYSCPSFEMI